MWHDTILGMKLPRPDHCHLQLGTPCSYYGVWVIHLLPSGFTWFWQSLGDSPLLLVPLFFGGSSLTNLTKPHHSVVSLGCYISRLLPSGTNMCHPLAGKEQSGSLCFLRSPISLTLGSTAVAFLLLLQDIPFDTSLPLLVSQGNHEYGSLKPLGSQIPSRSSSNYKTLPIASRRVSAHSLSTVLRDWNLLSLTLKKKPSPPTNNFPFNTTAWFRLSY